MLFIQTASNSPQKARYLCSILYIRVYEHLIVLLASCSVAHLQDMAARWLWTYNMSVQSQLLGALHQELFYKQRDSLVIFLLRIGGLQSVR
jgi:hypothetical protein